MFLVKTARKIKALSIDSAVVRAWWWSKWSAGNPLLIRLMMTLT
jgi:hypothetical protein